MAKQFRKAWVPPKSKLRRGVLPRDQTVFTGADLCALGGVGPRALIEWRRRGLLPRAPSTRRGVRYGFGEARLAAAIGRAGVQAAKLPRFAEMIPLILEPAPAMTAPAAKVAPVAAATAPAAPGATTAPAAPAAPAAPGATTAPAAPASIGASAVAAATTALAATAALHPPGSAADAPGAVPAIAALPGRDWRRIELLPGLELSLAADAPPVLRALVRDIARHFGRDL